MKKGLFITFEGVDGSGKTSVLKGVNDLLLKNGISNFIITREPGGSKIAEKIRGIILDRDNIEEDIKTEALRYAASRRQHLVDVIIKRLEEGVHVICDRYVDSSLAYQGYARGIGIEEVRKINEFAIGSLYPDLTIYLDLAPEEGLKRIMKNRENPDRLDVEKLSFHKKVYEGYEEVYKMFQGRIYKVDAKQDLLSVTKDAFNKVYEFIVQNEKR